MANNEFNNVANYENYISPSNCILFAGACSTSCNNLSLFLRQSRFGLNLVIHIFNQIIIIHNDRVTTMVPDYAWSKLAMWAAPPFLQLGCLLVLTLTPSTTAMPRIKVTLVYVSVYVCVYD